MRQCLLALIASLSLINAQTTEDSQVRAIVGDTIYNSGLIFNGHFTTNPATTLGVTPGYTWVEYDNPDAPAAERDLHKGVLRFDGTANSWVNLSASSGINSVGFSLPMFGGASLGTGERQGVTLEVVAKFATVANWAKVFVLADQPNLQNEIQLTWDGDSDNMNRLLFQQYIQQSVVGVNYDKGLMETFRPLMGTWYHIALVLKPTTLTVGDSNYGGGTWYLYVNGQQLALANAMSPGAAFTALQAANYPLRITRTHQYLAKSKYADPNGQYSLDAFRVYDVALNGGEISQLARIYGLNNTAAVIPTPADNKPFPAMPENTKHRTEFINFDPVYRLDFAVNPASQVGGTTDYQWMEFDSADNAADRAAHTGLVKFTNDNQYVDFMTATGPKSAGLVMPTLFTRSSGTGASYGWTFETVFKVASMNAWAKLFSLGTSPNQDVLYTGWRGSDNVFEVGNYNVLRDTMLNVANPAATPYYRAPLLNKWTHLAWVLEPTDKTNVPLANFSASWTLYVNGQLVVKTDFNRNFPNPIVRRHSTLGASNWNDPKARMTVDAFRIWDRALNGDQVESLSNAYSISPVDGGDWAWEQALGTARRPLYNLDFQANPVQNGQGPINWQWSEQDPADSTIIAGQHTGLATLDGSANSYISLNAITGPNRVYDGLAIPAIGGPTTPGAGYTSGWSIEMIFKPLAWSQWSKFVTLSNGADRDEIYIAFDASGDNMVIQQYVDDNAYGGQWNYAITEVVKPTVFGQWYHLVVTMRPGSVPGAGNWQVFINGQLQEWATRLVSGMTFTEMQGANYPLASARPNSFLGKSSFNDVNMRVTYDAFRVYDYILTPQQVSAFATAYACNVPLNIPTPSNNQPIPSTTETTNWQSAGLLTAPVFNGVFAESPASYVGGTIHYQWIGVDPTDSAEDQQRHRGIIVLNGTDAAYVDLTVPTGPKSVGLVMPVIGGAGTGQGNARGMTIEMVIKLLAVRGWSKLIQFSSGPDIDSLILGWNNDRYNTIEIHNMNAVKPGLQRLGTADIMNQPPIGRWMHLVCSLRLTDEARYDGEWNCYIDGELVATKRSSDSNNPANYPLPVYRQNTYLAKSAWDDPNAAMMLDMVRIHDYALTQAQIRSSATQYGQYGVVRPATNTTLPFPATTESTTAAGIVTRQPVFNAWFGSNPTSLVQSPNNQLDYTWAEFDTTDSQADQQKHRGIVKFSGAATSYIDLNTNTGPNSAGVVLPVLGGPGSGVGPEQGWSFETVFKVTRMNGWAKLFNAGNGPDVGNIAIGVDGSDVATMYVDVFDRDRTEFPHGLAELFQPQLGKWYHVVWQIAPVNMTAGSAVYYFYVNGKLLAYTNEIMPGSAFTPAQGAAYPAAIRRRNSYMGKSNWNDPLFEGAIDALRVYDYRLSVDQITRLADFYGCNNNDAVIPTPALNKAVNPSTVAEVRAWDREGIVEPVFNANFGMDPRPMVGGSSRYTWMETDPADTAENKAVHKGLIYLDGTEQSYIDIMKADGPNSVGLVIPTLFGRSSGIRNEKGWTIEMVCKIGRTEEWGKLFNFGTGGSDWMESLAISWWGDNTNLIIQNFLNLNPISTQPREEQNLPFMRPSLNRWYHITLVMQPTKPLDRFGAVWRVYVDGTRANRTTTQSNWPLPVVRDNSFIGASQWGYKPSDRMAQMHVDAFRVYDRALLPTQVAALARMYGHQPTVIAEPDLADWMDETGGSPGDSTSSSSSKLSGGAIAGIVIGAVVGAAILCVVVFCLFCGKSALGSSKKSHDEYPTGAGNYGEVEASSNQGHEVEMEETA